MDSRKRNRMAPRPSFQRFVHSTHHDLRLRRRHIQLYFNYLLRSTLRPQPIPSLRNRQPTNRLLKQTHHIHRAQSRRLGLSTSLDPQQFHRRTMGDILKCHRDNFHGHTAIWILARFLPGKTRKGVEYSPYREQGYGWGSPSGIKQCAISWE